MHLNNLTTGQLERLQLLGCPVTVTDGAASAPLAGLLLAGLSSVLHAVRVRKVRACWRKERRLDRKLGCHREAFWETYMITQYEAQQVLPARWFNRA
ncbi:hypothetical protein D3C76_649920 [compost metagenome]